MAFKRGGVAGSALATTLLSFLFFRGTNSLPAPAAQPNQAGPTSSAAVQKNAKKSSTKPKPQAAPEEEDTQILKGPWIASQKHFAGQARTSCPSAIEVRPVAALADGTLRVTRLGPEQTIEDLRAQLWCIPDAAKVQAMIAIVPDPVQTHLALFFDRMIEAIQLAAESTEYVVDRYWLPWDIVPKTDWGDYDSFKDAAKDQRQNATQPGLLVFRSTNTELGTGRPTLLYVFVVGEMPTAGVNGDQFTNAVEYVRLVERHSTKRGVLIHVMGPTLSGSLESLRRLTEAQEDMQQHAPYKAKNVFTIYSGTVLATKDEASFSAPTVFQRFQNPAADALVAVMEMLHSDWDIPCGEKGRHEVAVLSEADTVYGASATAAAKKKNCFDILEYPREIANLRNAYAASTVQNPTSGNAADKHPSLYLNLTDPTNSSDEAPDFSKTQSPLSKEAVLMNFAAEMQRRRYKYIGIIGTNELDVVFLISFLRKAVPDARVFLMDSDLLLQHEPQNVPYIGTFAVTTYPLLNRHLNQVAENISSKGADREGKRLPFSTRFEEGAYNATVCLVRTMLNRYALGHLYERTVCLDPDSNPDPPPLKPHPPLWLTTFGAGGPWPVEVLGTVPSPAKEDLPNSWKALCALLCVLAVLHVLILLGLAPFSPKFRDFMLGTVVPFQQLLGIHIASATLAGALAVVGLSVGKTDWCVIAVGLLLGILLVLCSLLPRKYWPSMADEAKTKAATIVFLLATWAVWGIASAWVVFGHPNGLPAGPSWATERWTMMAVGSLIGALCATCFLLTLKYRNWLLSKPKKPALLSLLSPTGRRCRIAGFALPWASASTLALLWWTLLNERSGHYGEFFAYRAVHLASVVSPLTPLLPLLAAIYLAAIFYVWHLRFNDKLRPRLNPRCAKSPGGEDPNKSRLGLSSERLIVDAVNMDVFNTVVGFLILVVWWLVFHPLRFALFERPRFQRVYELLFCFVILLILISGFRLDRIWRNMRTFLLELNRQQVREVFTQLKGEGMGEGEDWPSIWFYGSEDPDWDYMLRSHQVLQQLWDTPAKPDGSDDVDSAIRDIRATRWKLQGKSFFDFHPVRATEHDGKLEEACSRAQDVLAATLNQALDRLQAISGTPLTPRALGWQKLLEKFVALRWVAFIRAVIARIRLLIIFLAGSFSLAMISLVIYSFEPHRELLWSVTVLFIVIGFIIVNVLIQIHRDPILSMITGTEPYKLDPKFYIQMGALGIAPLLTLLATHFPSISQSLVSFLQPGLEALK